MENWADPRVAQRGGMARLESAYFSRKPLP